MNPEHSSNPPGFGVGDLVHDGEYYDLVNTLADDLPYYEKWCRHAGGDALEMCCGTGRLTIPLAKAGIRITGLDFAPGMLLKAQAKARAEGLSIPFVRGDMRDADLRKQFSMVFIPFNSLQNTYVLEDVERVFQTIQRHLKPDGLFLFDLFNPDIQLMVERSRTQREVATISSRDGAEVKITETCLYDPASQVNRVTWFYHFSDRIVAQKLDMRCFFPAEIDALLKYNGFRVLHKFGDFQESPFSGESRKQIFVCRRA